MALPFECGSRRASAREIQPSPAGTVAASTGRAGRMNPGGWRRSRARGERINIGAATACLYAFDLLHVGRDDLRRYELVERRALLRKYTAKAGPALLYSDHMEGDEGEAMFRHAWRLGLEGIVSKARRPEHRSHGPGKRSSPGPDRSC